MRFYDTIQAENGEGHFCFILEGKNPVTPSPFPIDNQLRVLEGLALVVLRSQSDELGLRIFLAPWRLETMWTQIAVQEVVAWNIFRFHPRFGEMMIPFDYRIFFQMGGSTTNLYFFCSAIKLKRLPFWAKDSFWVDQSQNDVFFGGKRSFFRYIFLGCFKSLPCHWFWKKNGATNVANCQSLRFWRFLDGFFSSLPIPAWETKSKD